MRKQVDEVNLLETMHAIMHLYRARQLRGVRQAEEGEGLAHMEMKALGFFARHPGAAQSDLVAHSGRDKAQVARLIRGLRERGLLDAEADEADRRSTRLSLSSAGQALHASLHRHDGALHEAALAGLSADERSLLQGLLGKVRANLEAGQG